MSHRPWRERIQDILDAINDIQSFTSGMTGDDFLADARTIMAVQACFTIIGEASDHLPDDVKARIDFVPWRAIKSMRNRIIHVYFGVDTGIVWKTIVRDLPPFKQALQDLLASDRHDSREGRE